MSKCIGCNQVSYKCSLFKWKHKCPCNICLVKVMCKSTCVKLLTFVNIELYNKGYITRKLF